LTIQERLAPIAVRAKAVHFSSIRHADLALRVLVIVAFLVLVALGATTSSIGVSSLRQEPASPLGTQIGNASSIRSDEYNAFSPIVLSTMATGGGPSTSPLAAPADLVHRYSSGGFFESVVYFDSTLLHASAFLPDAMVFAAHWWLPALFLFLFLPTWFVQIGARRKWGWFAATLIALAPAASWWTMMPIQLIAYTIAGSSLLLTAFSRFSSGRPFSATFLNLASGILLAGMPSFYVPWSLVLGLPIFVATVIWILAAKTSWKPKLLALGSAGLITLVFAAGILWENRDGIRALMETVYPGSRRSGGAPQDFGMLFGAPALAPMTQSAPIASNASELSTAFTVTFVWAAFLLVSLVKIRPFRDNVAIITVGAFGFIWLAWCTVDFGALGPRIPLLYYVQPSRAAQVCGVLGTILVGLLLSRLTKPTGWKVPIVAAVACGLVTAYAASLLRQEFLPNMTTTQIALASLGVSGSVLCLTWAHHRIWPILLASALAILPVFNANPLIFGLGDLRDSSTATYLRGQGEIARAQNKVWASDFNSFDNVAFSNGVPSLTGLQRSGPNREAWLALDPGGAHEKSWNRGGGFVGFLWTTDNSVTFSDNGADWTVVRINPCELKRRVPNLEAIASRTPLELSCLSHDTAVRWAGQDMQIYRFR
jgi:hypothetical protein